MIELIEVGAIPRGSCWYSNSLSARNLRERGNWALKGQSGGGDHSAGSTQNKRRRPSVNNSGKLDRRLENAALGQEDVVVAPFLTMSTSRYLG